MYKYFHDERQPLNSKNNLVFVCSEAASQSGGPFQMFQVSRNNPDLGIGACYSNLVLVSGSRGTPA